VYESPCAFDFAFAVAVAIAIAVTIASPLPEGVCLQLLRKITF